MTRSSAPPSAIIIAPQDNVAVVLRDFSQGETLAMPGHTVVCESDVPSGHKIALVPIADGANIVKCGVPVGLSRRAIAAGEHVHIHNVASHYITDH